MRQTNAVMTKIGIICTVRFKKLCKSTQKPLHYFHRYVFRTVLRKKNDYFHLRVSVMGTMSVYCAVGTRYLNIPHLKFTVNFTRVLKVLIAFQQQLLSLHQDVIPSSNYCGMFHPASLLIRLQDNGEWSLLHNSVAFDITEWYQVQ